MPLVPCELDRERIFLDTFRQIDRNHQKLDTHPLQNPQLYDYAKERLLFARGKDVLYTTPFHLTIWPGGATDTYRGKPFSGTFFDFVYLLGERAKVTLPKREGWVVEPTTNRNGHRTNESTLEMHALFLDCDATGEMHGLQQALIQLSYGFVLYQSGGYTDTTPKWRAVVPLSDPFPVDDELKRNAWKTFYNACRVLFGALGKLQEKGFDPATETPCCPWFLTEKRNADDLPRKIFHREGASLDALTLGAILPEMETETLNHKNAQPPVSAPRPNIQIDQIIRALIPVTAHVPASRRDLYLALPGVLLDRGLDPDEVLEIIENVSASYPRPDAERHRDNVHNAKTTIAKWQRDENNYTRIGTLNAIWPEIAQIIDRILPNTENTLLGTYLLGITPPSSPPAAPESPPETIHTSINNADVFRVIRNLIRKKRNSKHVQNKIDAELIENFMAAETLVSTADIKRCPPMSKYDGEPGFQRIAMILGQNLDVPWDAVINVRSRTGQGFQHPDVIERMCHKYKKTQQEQIKKNELKEQQKKLEIEERARKADLFYGVRR